MSQKFSAIKKILFFRTDRIGDFLLNLPALHALKATYPHAKITVVLRPLVGELLLRHPDIDETISFDTTLKPPLSSWWRLFKTLRQQKYDLAIVSNPHKNLHLLCFLLGIPHRIGYDRKWPFLLTRAIADQKSQSLKHEVEYNLDLVCAAGAALPPHSNPEDHYKIYVTRQEEAELEKLLLIHRIPRQTSLIVVNPYTTNPKKQWPIEKMRDLIKKLSASGAVLLIGGIDDQSRIKHEILNKMDVTNLFDLSGQLTLRQLSALLKKTDVLISNDSGPVHIAAAFGTKMVILFGTQNAGSNPARWGPWHPDHHSHLCKIVIKPDIRRISVDEVWETTRHQLTSSF